MFRTTKFNQPKRNEDVTAVSIPKCILRDDRRIVAASITTTPVGNLPVAPLSLEAALEEVAGPIPSAECQDTFEDLAGMRLSKKCSMSRLQSTKYCASLWLDDTVREQITSIPDLAEDTVIWLFGNAGRATELSSDT